MPSLKENVCENTWLKIVVILYLSEMSFGIQSTQRWSVKFSFLNIKWLDWNNIVSINQLGTFLEKKWFHSLSCLLIFIESFEMFISLSIKQT